ncbi:hypothetical protein [Leifsonia shinshuensis]|uniref:Uncharacterized protein n=1 Tax=Leifsonia shinshuensis TaxID=150026 RepID=A0A7G6YC89_9MICO|nr:hypothetical protein [Leifsonia shinshuensis]QNE36104.1 hypothetical protein F1C12_13920 [Leifsonia shinshuensis]
MSHLMPELLSTWSWRLDRVRNGRTVLTKGQAASARTDLVHDRSAHPADYSGYEEEYTSAVDALNVLAQQANRSDDLLAVLRSERRSQDAPARERYATAPDSTGGPRTSLAAEHDRVPTGLPEALDQWVHRLIRYRSGAKVIAPIEAARAEIRLRNEADLNPGAYRNATAAPYYGRVMRELGEIATAQRPGVHISRRGLHRGLSDDSFL